MKRLGRDAAELTAFADHLAVRARPGPGACYSPSSQPWRKPRGEPPGAPLEELGTAARRGKHGGRPPVITDDMPHTVLRRRAGGETVEQIQPDLLIPTGKREGQNPSLSSIYRALVEYEKSSPGALGHDPRHQPASPEAAPPIRSRASSAAMIIRSAASCTATTHTRSCSGPGLGRRWSRKLRTCTSTAASSALRRSTPIGVPVGVSDAGFPPVRRRSGDPADNPRRGRFRVGSERCRDR